MDDLISEFITETNESLAVLDSELVKFEQNPNDTAILGNIFRLVHTIKGTCGFLGLPRLESVAHASENVLGKIRDKELVVSPPAISLILESLDAIKAIMEFLATNAKEPDGDDADLIARLNKFVENKGVVTADAAAPVPVAAAAVAEPEAAAAAPAPVVEAPAPVAAVPAAKADEPAAAAKPAEDAKEGGMANQSIRVNLDVLENLMQMVGELVLTRNQLLQIARTRSDNTFMGPLQQLSHITTELQEGVMKTRMQPIGNAWAKFPRLIRDLSHELGKKIELRMIGAETELDRQMLEMIKDPLTHMVRNSCDHGLEMPADRKGAGKSEVGTVTLSAYHEGGHIIIEISDDGRGINVPKIKEKILKQGMATAAELDSMPDAQVTQYIFRAGFSTAEKVTSVSGRGVGMDVVRTNIEKIGGTIELHSTYGKGSNFHIKIPLTLAIVSVLIVEARKEKFAIPQINVLELVRATEDGEYTIEMISNASVLRLRDKLLPLISLPEILNLGPREEHATEGFIAVCRVGNYDFGLIVDRVYDTEEIVVKPVTSLLQHIPLYSGNTILGDGSVIMILDPNGLARAVGEMEGKGQVVKDVVPRQSALDRKISFLIFKAGTGAPKAVPLELVSRLEEIDTKTIEWSGEFPVVQYRGDLMRLVTLETGYKIPSDALCEVVVFNYDNKVMGLVVEEIIDIVEAPMNVKLTSKEAGYLGSMVITGKTTDVIDVGYLLRDFIDTTMSSNIPDIADHNINLLLVEDSMFFRNLTVPFLSAVGYQVTSAASGEEAISLLESGKKRFDIIVTDIEMPEMDGFGFAEACQSLSAAAGVPIIAFTSTINQQLLERGKGVGFRSMIIKTNREGLIQAIAQVLSLEKEAA